MQASPAVIASRVGSRRVVTGAGGDVTDLATWYIECQQALDAGNQRKAYKAFEFAFWNAAHPGAGGSTAVLEHAEPLRAQVTDSRWATKWDEKLSNLRASATAADALQPRAVTPAGQRLPATPPAAVPYGWADVLVVVFVGFAVLSVIGGFVEASNHSHTVYQTNEFGLGRHKTSQNDYTYAVAGVVAAMVWCGVAGIFALLRGIARDVRRQADATVQTAGAQPQPAPTAALVRDTGTLPAPAPPQTHSERPLADG
jgi:hypothetical protein